MSHLFTFDLSFSDLNYSGSRLRDLKKRVPGAVGEPEEKNRMKHDGSQEVETED